MAPATRRFPAPGKLLARETIPTVQSENNLSYTELVYLVHGSWTTLGKYLACSSLRDYVYTGEVSGCKLSRPI